MSDTVGISVDIPAPWNWNGQRYLSRYIHERYLIGQGYWQRLCFYCRRTTDLGCSNRKAKWSRLLHTSRCRVGHQDLVLGMYQYRVIFS
jgi:hypothetical protein